MADQVFLAYAKGLGRVRPLQGERRGAPQASGASVSAFISGALSEVFRPTRACPQQTLQAVFLLRPAAARPSELAVGNMDTIRPYEKIRSAWR